MKTKRNKPAPHNVWSGPEAIKNFLMPQNHITPLVELPRYLNPFFKKKVRIFAKAMYLLPLLSVKSLMASEMLASAQKIGDLKDITTIVESSSGNTAFALAILAKHFGIKQVNTIVPGDIASGKLELLRLAGAHITILGKDQNGIKLAQKEGRQKGFLNLGQYENETNPQAHKELTAPEIWKQTEETMTVFCAGLGTTGTAMGASRFFKKKRIPVTTLGVILEEDHAVPGVRTRKRLGEVSFQWEKEIDTFVEIKTKESFKKSLDLCRAGLLAGPSSGFALAGLLKFFALAAQDGKLDSLRNKNGEVVAVFICGDTPLPYLDKYSTHLDANEF